MGKKPTPLRDAVKTYVNLIDNAMIDLGTHLPMAAQKLFLDRERKTLMIEGDHLIDEVEHLELRLQRIWELVEKLGLVAKEGNNSSQDS